MNEFDGDRTVRLLASRGAAARLSRRKFLGGAFAAGLSGVVLGGCGSSAEGSGPAGGPGDQLNMYTWGEYNAPEVLASFTSEVGPRLQVDTFASNEEMIAKLVAAAGTSGYDIVVPTGTFVPQMSQNGLLEELDLTRIPNMANLEDQFLDQEWDAGNAYSVCKTWGTTGFVYDNTKIQRELTSWKDFLDAAQNEGAGATSVVDDPKEVVGIALFAQGVDVNTTDERELAEAERILLEQLVPHVTVFDSYPGGSAMSESSRVLIQAWNGDARQGVLAEGDTGRWKWVLPTEGSNLWMDNWAIVKGAQHTDAAYAFIDYILQPEVSLAELAYIGYHTGVKGIQKAAEEQGLERLDMVFFTEEQLESRVPMTLNEAHQRIVDIMGTLKANAGA
ncbi:polyamine ABC transporter substrate-binding protein [Pseudonocardia nigra]|uniref:polyamine ABC transporter substrate-binding protein n=1 Tax=Pseudonocardia nigra TaxID=1921578 RepID=UPI001C5FB968|nr:spermidine/putrescine ABC transporter substrate-binding protein [Pseudonocardia nigra]